MNEYQMVSLISLVALLIFIGGGFRAHTVSWKRGFYMAAAWAGIFAIVILFMDLMSGA